MNAHELNLEDLLRLAPRPTPPADLKGRLIAQIRLSAPHPAAQPTVIVRSPVRWLRRWWPALAPATISFACAVVLTVQQMEIRDLKGTIQTLSRSGAGAGAALSPSPAGTLPAATPAGSSDPWQQEISRLKQQVSQLTSEIAALEQMRAENARLRTQLAASPAYFTPEETAAMAKARDRALSIQCVNNLKQLGLAVRVWAVEDDGKGVSPPDCLSMSNEIATPKLLVCPAESNRQAAANWAAYTPANCPYEYLAPSGSIAEPSRVAFRCPIHGTILLMDGSVQQGVAKTHPEDFVQRDGKLYFEPRKP